MKIPIPKEEEGKRMMMTSGTSTGRKGLICEHRETSLIGGHDTQSIQFTANMNLGSGDTPDHYDLSTEIQNNYDSLNWESTFDSRNFSLIQPTITKTQASGSILTPSVPSLSKSPVGETTSYSSKSLNENTSRERLSTEKSDDINSFEVKLGLSADAINSTLAVVEDSKEPNFTANESNPTVPIPNEPSKTSTLRLSDRTRSESEDDIEKMDEPEQEGTLIGHEKNLYKAQTTTENSPNSEKIDKNGNRSDSDQNEADDCVVQCLYYTIQCCECVIF